MQSNNEPVCVALPLFPFDTSKRASKWLVQKRLKNRQTRRECRRDRKITNLFSKPLALSIFMPIAFVLGGINYRLVICLRWKGWRQEALHRLVEKVGDGFCFYQTLLLAFHLLFTLKYRGIKRLPVFYWPSACFLWRYLATYAILIISLFELCSNTQNMNQPLSLRFDGFRLNASSTECFSFPFSSSLDVNKIKNNFLPVAGHHYGT